MSSASWWRTPRLGYQDVASLSIMWRCCGRARSCCSFAVWGSDVAKRQCSMPEDDLRVPSSRCTARKPWIFLRTQPRLQSRRCFLVLLVSAEIQVIRARPATKRSDRRARPGEQRGVVSREPCAGRAGPQQGNEGLGSTCRVTVLPKTRSPI